MEKVILNNGVEMPILGFGVYQIIDPKKLFITTKLWIQDTGYESTKKAFARSLEKPQLNYLDLFRDPVMVKELSSFKFDH